MVWADPRRKFISEEEQGRLDKIWDDSEKRERKKEWAARERRLEKAFPVMKEMRLSRRNGHP